MAGLFSVYPTQPLYSSLHNLCPHLDYSKEEERLKQTGSHGRHSYNFKPYWRISRIPTWAADTCLHSQHAQTIYTHPKLHSAHCTHTLATCSVKHNKDLRRLLQWIVVSGFQYGFPQSQQVWQILRLGTRFASRARSVGCCHFSNNPSSSGLWRTTEKSDSAIVLASKAGVRSASKYDICGNQPNKLLYGLGFLLHSLWVESFHQILPLTLVVSSNVCR